jgi:hypothetical protein
VGEGPEHHVVAADFDGDGDDEFLVATFWRTTRRYWSS